MVKISKKLRDKLLKQQQEMASGGLLISNKNFTKARLRMLPVLEDELPGTKVVSFYCGSLSGDKKATTSPETFGFPCPIRDFFATTAKKMSKEDREEAYNIVNTNTEYWILVLDRADVGDADNVKLRILAGKKTVYQRVQNLMLDDDLGEDITDPVEGRDLLVKKTGQGKSGTEWTCEKLDQMPLHDDEDMYNAILEASGSFVMEDHFFAVDWDVLAAIYEALTGKAIPKKYLKNKGKVKAAAPATEEEEYEDEVEEEEEDEVEEEAEEEEDEVELAEGDIVSFNDEGKDYEGTYIGVTHEDEDIAVVEVTDEDGENPEEWEIEFDNLSKVEEAEEEAEEEEEEEAEEEEDEEEEEPPAVSRRRSARKPTAKKPAVTRKKKTAKKPAVTKKKKKKKTAAKPAVKPKGKKTGKKTAASKTIRKRMRRKPRGEK